MARPKNDRLDSLPAEIPAMGAGALEPGDRKWFREKCVEAGMSRAMADLFWARIHDQGEVLEFDAADDDGLGAAIEDRLKMILQSMDAVVARTANLHQLSGAFKTLFDTRQLLKGKPTNIISIEDRRAIQEVGQRLVEEMQRRGMVQPEMKDVTPK